LSFIKIRVSTIAPRKPLPIVKASASPVLPIVPIVGAWIPASDVKRL
jgi:hypothetical protein